MRHLQAGHARGKSPSRSHKPEEASDG
jgi:hypothetical protein